MLGCNFVGEQSSIKLQHLLGQREREQGGQPVQHLSANEALVDPSVQSCCRQPADIPNPQRPRS